MARDRHQPLLGTLAWVRAIDTSLGVEGQAIREVRAALEPRGIVT